MSDLHARTVEALRDMIAATKHWAPNQTRRNAIAILAELDATAQAGRQEAVAWRIRECNGRHVSDSSTQPAGGEDARDADSVRAAPEHPTNAVRRALLRFAETTEDEGATDLSSDVLTGLVAFGYLTRRRAGRHGYFYEITPAGDAIVTGQAAAAMKETK